MVRARWAAVGAAVAITLGGGGLGLAHAAISSGTRTAYVPISPCRLLDTRPAPDTVGPRTAALGPDETYTVQVTGDNGGCTGIPADAAAVAMNVTIARPSASSYLTVFPADVTTPPTASNLNWSAGQAPTPNKVDVKLSPSGAIKIFNKFGTVHVIADVVGYYQDHNHDDRYYTKAQIDSQHPLSASTGVGSRCSADDTHNGGTREGVYDPCSAEITLGDSTTHAVLLVADIGWGSYQSATSVKGACRIERNGVVIPLSEVTMGETLKTTEESNAGGIDNRRLNWAGVTVVSGPNAGTATYRVACREVVGDMQFNEVSLSGVVTSL